MNMFAVLTEEQRIQKAVVDIMHNPMYVALSGVLMMAKRSVADEDITAYTDGRDEVYGREFVASLNDAELRFLILHETYHRLYRHLITWLHLCKIDKAKANAAMDYVINIKLVDDNTDKFATMTGPLAKGWIDTKYRGWDTAKVFHDIYEEGGEEEGESPDGEGGDGEGGDGEGGESGEGFDEHDWEAAQDMPAEEVAEIARELDQAVRQGAMAAGKMGSQLDASLTDMLQPEVDWEAAIREFAMATCAGRDYSTYARPNRRFMASGIILPSGVSERVDVLVAAVDTSGSCWDEQPMFVAEVKSMAAVCKPSKLIILYWDTDVERVETYDIDDMDNPVIDTKPCGGGGTDVECVPKWLADNNVTPQACVVLTDGYLSGGWGQWTCPLLWCFVNNDKANPPSGKRVFLPKRRR
jgi:predicted metal-dependent peptidase|tara:strand:+ start:1312 stop:2547 length:1236 start_codon:yes stop_codon:yes gene_type:complete